MFKMNIPGAFLRRSYRLKCTKCLGRSLSTATEEKIEIPARIERGPTDILRALESTITRDITAAHYKYHDDPYLLPMNNLAKRSFAMAQEAGRKAAHWVRSQHPELFNHQECDPPIEAFFPKMVYNENSEVTEEDLKNVIDRAQVSDAILINNLLKAKGLEITNETKQSLLELLCYNNSEDILDEEFIEERWFKQSSGIKDRQRKTWKDASAAEEIFISIDKPTSDSYSAIIQGMAKFNQAARAYQLLEEAQEKGFELNIHAYNSIIKCANFIKENYDLRWSFIVNMLERIKQAGLKPNLGTLNAVLFTLSTMVNSRMVKDFALKTLNEFKSLDIEPSLGSWYYILITFCKDRGPRSAVLKNILNEIENKNHKIQDLSDTHFFVTAMDIAHHHLNDISVGQRLHKLLLFGNNYDLIGDSYKESIYYRHYFSLVLSNVPLQDFMESMYNKLVPNIYVPEPSVMREVIKQIELNALIEYIPRIWSDIIVFNQHNREDLLNLILSVMVDNKPKQDTELVEKFANIGWDIYETIDGQNQERYSNLQFTGDLLGKIMIVLLRNDNFEKACTVMNKLDHQHQSIVGVPCFEALSLFVDHCIKNKAPSRAIECIQYASDSGFPDIITLGAKLNEQLTLDEKHLNRLSKFVDLKLS
ncbi:unnamed protein product [Ceutorhynchus assimilis]|uniref:Small ribosomal subunit protein mS39 n=1 Tax=Ceutorhynchus assimilis TaxID=467358 RepID=A0A9N9MSF2_9CUCU|nr:unnamed protein product [Ceutorhynchus assimilis]